MENFRIVITGNLFYSGKFFEKVTDFQRVEEDFKYKCRNKFYYSTLEGAKAALQKVKEGVLQGDFAADELMDNDGVCLTYRGAAVEIQQYNEQVNVWLPVGTPHDGGVQLQRAVLIEQLGGSVEIENTDKELDIYFESFYDCEMHPNLKITALAELIATYGVNVSFEALQHNYEAWQSNYTSGYFDKANNVYVYTPSGDNPLRFSIDKKPSNDAKTYVC